MSPSSSSWAGAGAVAAAGRCGRAFFLGMGARHGILSASLVAFPTAAMVSSDLSAAASTLSALARTLKASDSPDLWRSLQLTARSIADALRVKDPVQDNHTLLGRSPLPTTLTNLLSLALHGASVPDLAYSPAVNELLRVAANLSMDHSKSDLISSRTSLSRSSDENRGHLLEAGFPQATSSLLESYVELVPQPPTTRPFPFTAPHLNVIRSAIGVLLNSSVGYGACL